MKHKEETINFTDHREFRNELDAYLNAGVKLRVEFDREAGIMRIILLAVE